jgi:hypothetical protein
MRTLPLVALVALALAAGGCGGSSKTTSSLNTNPTASAPDATAPPSDATQPGTNPVTTQAGKPKARTNPQAASIPQYSSTTSSGAPRTRMPADFVVRGGKLVPAGISGPSGIPVDVSVVSGDGKAHTLLIEVPPKPRTLSVAPGGKATLRIQGLKAGAYGIELDGHVAGGLVIGRQPGP